MSYHGNRKKTLPRTTMLKTIMPSPPRAIMIRAQHQRDEIVYKRSQAWHSLRHVCVENVLYICTRPSFNFDKLV